MRSSNRSRIAAWRPNTVTSSWPVKDSSMCPLRRPVFFHCALKSFCDFEPMTPTTAPAIGRATSAMSASCHESANIMIVMPTIVSTA